MSEVGKGYLLDTNVVSEWVKAQPDSGVAGWLAAVDEDGVYLSVVTLAEVRSGVERMPKGKRRERLERWLVDVLPDRFEGRILNIDAQVADLCGRLSAEREAMGRPIGAMDALIAASAVQWGLTVVTRNQADFSPSVPVFSPWTQS